MADLIEYKCPSCGGKIEFDSTSQQMKCPFCLSEYDLETLKAYDEELKADRPESEMNWESEAGSDWQQGEAENLRAKIVGEGAGGSVEWHSDDTDIAMVDGDGEVIGMGVGETRIVARYGEAEAVCTVTVEERPVKSVDLDKGKLRMKVGESYQLRCVVRPSDATDKRLEWASSDESVATVDEFGNVTAVGRGSAKIGVRAASGVYDVCKVKVE